MVFGSWRQAHTASQHSRLLQTGTTGNSDASRHEREQPIPKPCHEVAGTTENPATEKSADSRRVLSYDGQI